MGLDITLVDCNGEVLETVTDPKNFLHRFLPEVDEGSEGLLDKIDWYGDTYFNYLQMRQFLIEWNRLLPKTSNPEEAALIQNIEKLAVRCQNERDILRFIGD
jgi:hypothetical protein